MRDIEKELDDVRDSLQVRSLAQTLRAKIERLENKLAESNRENKDLKNRLKKETEKKEKFAELCDLYAESVTRLQSEINRLKNGETEG